MIISLIFNYYSKIKAFISFVHNKQNFERFLFKQLSNPLINLFYNHITYKDKIQIQYRKFIYIEDNS